MLMHRHQSSPHIYINIHVEFQSCSYTNTSIVQCTNWYCLWILLYEKSSKLALSWATNLPLHKSALSLEDLMMIRRINQKQQHCDPVVLPNQWNVRAALSLWELSSLCFYRTTCSVVLQQSHRQHPSEGWAQSGDYSMLNMGMAGKTWPSVQLPEL